MAEPMLLTAVYQALSMNDLSLAEEYALQLKEEQKDNPAVFRLLGTIYTRKREYIKAIDAFRQSNSIEPGNPDTLNNLAIVYKKSGDVKGALKALKQAYNKAPDQAEICYNIANLYKDSGSYDTAENFYKKAIALKPDMTLAYNNLGTMYKASGDIDHAIFSYKKGLEKDQNHPKLHFNLGVALLSKKEYEKAVEEFRQAVKSRPGWIDGLNNLGAALLECGRDEDALHTFMNAYRVNPDTIQTLNNLGFVLTKLKRFKEASGYLQKAVKLNPDYVDAVLNLGKLQEQSGSEIEATEAINLLKSIITKGTATTGVRLLLGKLLLQKERFAEASDTIRSTLRRDPENSEGNTLLGILNLKTGRKKRALARFNKALEISPSNLEARYQRALLFHDGKRYKESLPDLEYIFTRNPDFFQTKMLLAETCLQTGDFERALKLYQELKKESPERERILNQLVFLYKQAGKKEEALREAEELVVLQEQEDNPESIKHMERSLSLYEGIINDFSKDYNTILNRNISLYLDEMERLSLNKEKQDEESLLMDAFPDLDHEVVPILDFGGIEPIIKVNEEDREILNLEEMEEILDLPDEEEDIEHIKAALIRDKSQNGEPSYPGHNYPSNPAGSPQAPSYPYYPQVQVVPVPQVIVAQPVQPSAGGSGGTGGSPAAPQIIVHYNQPSPKKTVPAIRKEERDRRKHDEFQENSADPVELLGYLENLTQYLPDEKQKAFNESEMKLKIETLKAKMNGRPGLVQIIEKKYGKGDTVEKTEVISRDKVASTFEFMNTLTDFLPDKSVSSTIKQKIDHILSKMKDVHGQGKTP